MLLCAAGAACTGASEPIESDPTDAANHAFDSSIDANEPVSDALDETSDAVADAHLDEEVSDDATDGGADAGDAPELDVEADAPSDDAKETDASLDDASSDADAPISTFCGDGVRGLATEECDDGLGSDAGRRTCTSTCRVVDVLAVAPSGDAGALASFRSLTVGRHAIAATGEGVAVAFTRSTTKTASITTFDASGVATDVVVQFSVAPAAIDLAASLAGLPAGKVAVVWNEPDGDATGVAMRVLSPPSSTIGALTFANATKHLSQRDPDVVWTGGELVVAWVDHSVPARMTDLKLRRFSSSLVPLGGEEDLASTSDSERDVALAPFGSSWAAAWRTLRPGSETLYAKTPTRSWFIGPFAPGPDTARPALVALDATHLLLAFAVGDESADASFSSTQLRVAVLDTASPGATSSTVVAGAIDPLEVALARAGTRTFLGWRARAVPGDGRADELWLREVGWTSGGLDLSPKAIPVPRDALHRMGDQRFLALAGTPTALWLAWDDHGRTLPGALAIDVAAQRAPVPILRLEAPTDGGT